MSEKSGCCGGGGSTVALSESQDVRTVVREKYAALAEGKSVGCGCGCAPGLESTIESIGYTKEQIDAIPEGADLGLGCGNPLAHAELREGEVVLDLGAGAGIDSFLAAKAVGPRGLAIGVDMTPAMLEKARANAAKVGATNVDFRLGEIEHLPVADASVDVVISNCVINLSPDKRQVFREALRALKPGGRMVVSDLVLERPLPPELMRNVELYVGCVAGALVKSDFVAQAREAGFDSVEIVEEHRYTVGRESLPEGSDELNAFDAVTSIKVRALKKR